MNKFTTNFKQKLLKSLEDEEVRTELIKIFSNEINTTLSTKQVLQNKSQTNFRNLNKSLKQKIAMLKKENSGLKEHISDLNTSIEKLQKENLDSLSKLEDRRDEIDKLQAELSQLTSENSDLVKDYNSLNSQVQESKQKINALNKEKLKMKNKFNRIESANNDLANKVKDFERKYKNPEEYFKLFTSLSKDTLNSLEGIFGTKYELIEFLINGTKSENIDSLWDFIKYNIQNNKRNDLDKLIKLFDFLFNLYQKSAVKALYKRSKTQLNQNFDMDLHIRSAESQKMSGSIQEVILQGYKNNFNHKIVKKSIVRI